MSHRSGWIIYVLGREGRVARALVAEIESVSVKRSPSGGQARAAHITFAAQ